MTTIPSPVSSGEAGSAPVGSSLPPTGGGGVQIAFVTDTKMFQPTLVSMMSVIEGASEPITVHFFGHQLSDAERDQIVRAVRYWPATQVRYHEVTDEMVDGGKSNGYHTPAQMAVLHIPRLLSGKVLYLDGDTLVHGDVVRLFDLDLEGNLVGAARDSVRMLMMMNLMPEHQGADLKLNNDRLAPYGENDMFNTGVVLFDIDAIRSESGMVDNIANHMDFGCDQQSLNYHLKGRVRYLDPVWNAMPGTFHLCHWLLKAMTEDETIYNISAPHITHYVGIAKPWHDFDPQGLRRDVNGVRQSVFRNLGLGPPFAPHELFNWLTNNQITLEYAHAVIRWRKSAARYLSMV